MLRKHEANPQETNNTEARSSQSRFATFLKSKKHPQEFAVHPQNTLPRDCFRMSKES